jgi:ligand-binding sensor domain-containing protein
MVIGGVQNALSVFSAQNEWENYYITNISNSYPNQILIDSKNRKWLNIWRTDKSGMVLLDENNVELASGKQFVDQLGTDIQASAYLCMAEDQYGNVWVGTDNGPISFSVSNPDGVKNGVCFRNTVVDQYGLNNYILEKEKINAIAVDGGNRKWMGTENSGVFVLEETTKGIAIENFNTENSYLLSNKINSIAINNETGEVFIGTDKGLCSYFCGAITGKNDYEDVYAFPNPVRPAVNSRVTITGLMQDSSVKITDMAGSLIVQGQSLGGQFTWDCTNRSGEIVKAGIYLVFAATPTGDKGVVTKIMVIK